MSTAKQLSSDKAADTVDVITEDRRQEALLSAGALQSAIFNSANFSHRRRCSRRLLGFAVVTAQRLPLHILEKNRAEFIRLFTDSGGEDGRPHRRPHGPGGRRHAGNGMHLARFAATGYRHRYVCCVQTRTDSSYSQILSKRSAPSQPGSVIPTELSVGKDQPLGRGEN